LSTSATFSADTGDYAAAEEKFRRAQLILVRSRDTDPAAVAYTSGKLAKILAREKRTDEAQHEFLNALSIMERTVGKECVMLQPLGSATTLSGPWLSIALDYRNLLKESGLPTKLPDLDADIEKIRKAKISLRDMNEFEVVSSHYDNFEVTAKGVSKGNAVKVLADYYRINSKQVICIGDSENDSSMIIYAGLGIAMGNADDVVKEAAKYITDTNNSDGVAKAIEKFVLEV